MAGHGFRSGVLAAFFLLGGCSFQDDAGLHSVLEAASPRQAMIAPGAWLVLPRPGDFGRPVEIRQFVAIHQGQNLLTSTVMSFEARLSVKPRMLNFVAIDPLGRRAMTLSWDGAALTVEKAQWLPDSVRPDSLLADIIALYWPRDSVHAALAGAGGEVVDSPRKRVVRIGQSDVLTADYGWTSGAPLTGNLHYTNAAWDYQVDVRSVELGR